MSANPVGETAARARDLVTAFQLRNEEFLATLDASRREVDRRRAQGASRKWNAPAQNLDAKAGREPVDWEEVVRGSSTNPSVQAAQQWLGPRVRLLQRSVFNACHAGQPVDEVFTELDAEITKSERGDTAEEEFRSREQGSS